MADLRKIKEKLVKKGIVFQAAAIGWDKKAIQEIYGNAYLDIQIWGTASSSDQTACKVT